MPGLSPAGEDYLAWLAVDQGRRPATIDSYRRDLTTYERFLAERGLKLGDVAQPDVAAYLSHLQTAGRKPSSVARAMAAVRGLHRWMATGGGSDPTRGISAPRPPEPASRSVSESDVARLLSAVVGDSPSARRDRAILELLYGTGVRGSELVELVVDDVDIGGGMVRIASPAAKRERELPVPAAAMAAVASWLGRGGRDLLAPPRWATTGDAGAAFLNARGGRLTRQGVWLVMRRAAARAGLENVHPHMLRQAFAAHLLDRGAPPDVVQELLGHTPPALGTDVLRAVVASCHPREASTSPG